MAILSPVCLLLKLVIQCIDVLRVNLQVCDYYVYLVLSEHTNVHCMSVKAEYLQKSKEQKDCKLKLK